MKKKFCLALVFASALTAAACGIGNRSSEKPDGINENGVLESLSELFDEDTDQIQESALKFKTGRTGKSFPMHM